MAYAVYIYLVNAVLNLLPLPASAADTMFEKLNKLANTIGFATIDTSKPEDARQKIAILVGRVMGAMLVGLGTMFIIFIVFAGFIWMNSGGNEQKVASAKKMILASIIGIAIIALEIGRAHV